MTTSDQNQPHPQQGGGATEQGGATGTAPAQEAGGSPDQRQQGRHERGRRRGGRRPEQEQQPRPQQQRPQQQPRRGDATLNLEELRDLAELFSTHGLTDFEFENADVRIRLSRNAAPQTGASAQAATPSIPIPPPQQAPASALSAAAQSSAQPAPEQPALAPQASSTPAAAPEEELHIITSPIVGTFYRSPAPTAESFVKVGSHVGPDTVVCIIEAMKLMNEIQAETEGTVEKIYVENGQPVEYGQPLFGVKK